MNDTGRHRLTMGGEVEVSERYPGRWTARRPAAIRLACGVGDIDGDDADGVPVEGDVGLVVAYPGAAICMRAGIRDIVERDADV